MDRFPETGVRNDALISLAMGCWRCQDDHEFGREGARMATYQQLLALVGTPVESEAVKELISVDQLGASGEEDLNEGEPVRGYLFNTSKGYQLMHHSGHVSTAFLFAEPAEDFVAFPGPLPGNLAHGSTRDQVRVHFGMPDRSGEAFTSPFLGRQGAWDRYAVDEACIHFQYTDPERQVRLITIMNKSEAP